MNFELVKTKDTRENKPGTYIPTQIIFEADGSKTEEGKNDWHSLICEGLFKGYFLTATNDGTFMFADNPKHGFWNGKNYDTEIVFSVDEYIKLKNMKTEKFDKIISNKLIDKCLETCFEKYLNIVRNSDTTKDFINVPSINKMLTSEYVLPISVIFDDSCYNNLLNKVHSVAKNVQKNTYLSRNQKIAYFNIEAECYNQLFNQDVELKSNIKNRYLLRETNPSSEDNHDYAKRNTTNSQNSEVNFFNQLFYLDFSDPSKNLETYYIVNGNFGGLYLTNTQISEQYQKDALQNWADSTFIELNQESLGGSALMLCTNPEKGYFKGNKDNNGNLHSNYNNGYAKDILFGIPKSDMLAIKDIALFDALIEERLINNFVYNYLNNVLNKSNLSLEEYEKSCFNLPSAIFCNNNFSRDLINCFEFAIEKYTEFDNSKIELLIEEIKSLIEHKKLVAQKNAENLSLPKKENS